ncbi:MAG: thioredoxin domain-containing protein [Deltaproteobacteria bacterium]
MHRLFITLAIFSSLFALAPGSAQVEAKVLRSIKTDAAPLDIVSTDNANQIFVLSAGGKLTIYTATGQVREVIAVDPGADRIALASKDGKKILVSSSKNKTVQLVSLAGAEEINIKGSPYLGNPDAPVTLIVFSDFQCPYCARLGEVIEEVTMAYPDSVKVVFKNFPLRQHRYASLAALAAIAAQQQGRFWEFHDQLFPLQKELNQGKILKVAQDIGLDMKEFTRDIGSESAKQKLATDISDGRTAGVHGTPTVFINGREPTNLTFEEIKKLIDADLRSSASPSK